jgi:hypothetical protein
MVEQTAKEVDVEPIAELFRCKLKSIPVETLEQSIAKVVGDLVGVELDCSIKQIEYGGGAFNHQGAKFSVALSEVFKGFGS